MSTSTTPPHPPSQATTSHHPLYRYIPLKLAALFLRWMQYSAEGPLRPQPDGTLEIPSRQPSRTIKLHVYEPAKSSTGPSPVLLTAHGSGFILPLHGQDDAYCKHVAERAGYTVLDLQYRRAPEDPFPAALEDMCDAARWVLEQPARFDLTRFALGGFSAGGNISIAAALSDEFPAGTFSASILFYPATDLSLDPKDKVAPEPGGTPFAPSVLNVMNACYMPAGCDRRDPRLSPAYADLGRMPMRVCVITCGWDNLAPEAERFVEVLRKAKNKDERTVVARRFEGVNHAWDKAAVEGSREWRAKEEAYQMAVDLLLL